jgi:tetratricopeptide (TPR) repeat protein
MVDGKIQVTGQVAVMEINALLVKSIFQKNPDREFYVEESFPLDWMYPYLSPHGLIFKLQPKPLTELRVETVQQDQDYWRRFTGELIGNWLTEKTTVKEVCDFGEKVYLHKDLSGFKGDAGFAGNDESQKCFSKLRSAIAGLYVWRGGQAKDEDEKIRMRQAADLAYRQALALCPYSPEAAFRYAQLLENLKRHDDALRVAETFLRHDPNDASAQGLVRQLRKAD